MFPAALATAQQAGPVTSWPGSAAQIVRILEGCPAFTWAPVQGALSYELVVYAFDQTVPVSERAMKPSQREKLSRSASSWTPPRDRCLSPGSYAWAVRASLRQGMTNWSELKMFRVEIPKPADYAVTVTAQKRPENILDVPISITALKDDQIDDAGVKNSLELPALVPGLEMDRIGASTIPAIRGVSSYLTTVGTDANVAMYVDNIYVSSMQAATLDLSDISRVEVLKGPQGTLFGRNATGGAIRIFTKEPQLKAFHGDFSVSYGNFNDAVVKFFLTGPIVSGKLAFSITGSNETGDTYYHNLTPDVPLQGIHDDSLRGKLLFTPTARTRITIGANTGQHRDPSAILYFPLDGITSAQGVPGAIIPTTPYDVATNVPIYEKVSGNGVNIQLSQDTPVGVFSVLGAQSLVKSEGPVPLVAAAYPAPFTGYQGNVNDRSEAFSGEADFASRKLGSFSFVAGSNYYDKADIWNPLTVSEYLPGNEVAISIFAGQSTRAYAFYGEASYQVTDNLILSGGLRYTSETRGATGSGVPGIQATGDYYNWGSRTFDSVTERASARYDLPRKTDAYFTYSTGFESGNFIATSIPFGVTPAQCAEENAAAAGSCALPPVLQPETITAFEGGIKSAPVSRLQFDAAVFGYKLSNVQLESYENVCLQAPCPPNPVVQLSGYTNAASATMRGAEANANVQVTRELLIRGGVSLLDAKFSSYEDASWVVPAPGNVGMIQVPTTSADGKVLPRAPRETLNLSAVYIKNLRPGVFSFTATGYASGRIYYDVGNVFSQAGYGTLGLRVSFSPASMPKIKASVWGNNVTGTRVILGTILGSSGADVSFAPPATYGATIGYSF